MSDLIFNFALFPIVRIFFHNCPSHIFMSNRLRTCTLSQAPILWATLQDLIPNTVSYCSSQFAVLMCQNVYRPCTMYPDNLPCQSTCQGMRLQCPSSIQSEILYPFLSAMPSPFTFAELSNCSSITSYNPNPQCQSNINYSQIAIELPAPQCQTYSGTFCSGVINYPVYVPPMYTQEDLELKISSYHPILSVATVATGCREQIAKHICSSAFLQCETDVLQKVGIGVSVAFPRFPCQSLCQQTLSMCSSFFEEIPQLTTDFSCNSSNISPAYTTCQGFTLPGLPDYPIQTTTFALLPGINGSIPITSSCNNFTTNNSLVIQSLTCPSPLVIPNNPTIATIMGGSCSLPCPSFEWTDQEWSDAEMLLIGLSVISCVCMSVCVLTWSIFPKRRKQHHLHMFMICQFIFSLLLVISIPVTHGRVREIGCQDNAQIFTQDNGGYCTFQGVGILFTINAAVLWWTIIGIQLFSQIVLEHRLTVKQRSAQDRIYHLICCGIPSILCITALSQNWIGRGTLSPWCLFKDNINFYTSELPLFYLPIMIQAIIGALLMVVTLSVLIRHQIKTNNQSTNYVPYLRPILFVIVFLVLVSILCIYRWVVLINQPSYQTAATNWFTCLFMNGDSEECTTRPDSHPSLELWHLLIFCVAGEGILPSLSYIFESIIPMHYNGLQDCYQIIRISCDRSVIQ